AEEIVRQLRLRDLGGIIVVDFIDMVLESNRELVLRRLMECLGRDRTKHQVAEVTSLGLVQMTRKRVGQGLLESFSETCPECQGRGVIVHMDHGAPTVPDRGEDQGRRENGNGNGAAPKARTGKGGRERGSRTGSAGVVIATVPDEAPRAAAAAAIAKIAAASLAHSAAQDPSAEAPELPPVEAPEVIADAVPPSRPSRRGRRGASAPAGSPTPVEAVEVTPADVVAVEAVELPVPDSSDVPAEPAAPAPRPRRRRGGGGQAAAGEAAEPAAAPAAEPLPLAAAVATAAATPSTGTAPRRRRAASRPAGPAAMSAPPT
ncbi:MAG: ribonuclease, partial [Frankiales bacterium]|nr:ribonuclease [Frankiales bacterium]